MKYNQLSNVEKIACIQEMNICRSERHEAAVYLNALRTNNRAVIEEYEHFGERPYQILLNRCTYEAGLKFGFTGRCFDENGWLRNDDFTEQEQIEFFHKGASASFNYLNIGKGSNGKWSYGVTFSTGAAGRGYGLGVWGSVCDTRKECLKAALQEILNGHREYAETLKGDTCGNFNAKLSREVVRQVKNMFNKVACEAAVLPSFEELAGKEAKQLSLF